MMMYDREKATISAPGISLFVSSDRKVATKYSDRQALRSLIRKRGRLYESQQAAQAASLQA